MIARLAVVLAIVGVAVLVGRWWQSRQGRVRAAAPASRTGEGAPAGDQAVVVPTVVSATLVSTPTCRTCPQVRRALDDVAARAEDFTWDEVDASRDPEVVRTHDVRRAPTVLFRDAQGRVVARAAGAMGPHQVAEAIGLDRAVLAA